MSRAKKLTGETEIIAAIYDPDTAPSAIILFNDSDPHCVHSFRENSLQDFEITMERVYREQGKERGKGEPLTAKLFESHLQYPIQSHTCHGCHFSTTIEIDHKIRDSVEACTKQHADCA